MGNALIDEVLVGADRILATGHVFNKIGTSTVAIVADHYDIPFYVAAPTSSFDLSTPVGQVQIEQRDAREVAMIGNYSIAPRKITICNPAFDMTTPDLIDGIITEKGVICAPYDGNIRKVLTRS